MNALHALVNAYFLRPALTPDEAVALVDKVLTVFGRFLESDDASYVSGQEIAVDGGVINAVLAQLPRE